MPGMEDETINADTQQQRWGWLKTGMANSLISLVGLRQGFCEGEHFQSMLSGFVDSFTTHVHSQGLASWPGDLSTWPRPLPALALPAVERLVAIGDLHGDLEKCRRAFRLGGLTDANDRWVGGSAVVVQVGDILDRGDDEVAINYFIERLEREAARAGGAVYVLNGNHEIINAGGRFTYATRGAAQDFLRWNAVQHWAAGLKDGCRCRSWEFMQPFAAMGARTEPAGDGGSAPWPGKHPAGLVAPGSKWAGDLEWEPRAAAVQPGGPFTTRFHAHRPVALQIGSSVFVHGGLLPRHVDEGLQKINEETSRWLRGEMPESELEGRLQPPFLAYRDSPVWTRKYSERDEGRCNCEALKQALGAMPGAQRMVVGHTIQTSGINSACDGRVLRVDVGMSEGCGNGAPEVVEIRSDREVYRLQEGAEPVLLDVIPDPSINAGLSSSAGKAGAAGAVHQNRSRPVPA